MAISSEVVQKKAANGLAQPDFVKFWLGETISSLGDAFSAFALPLLVFKLTGSALNLALTTALTMLPYLCFGLLIGAWVDRTNRKRLMIMADVGRAVLISSLPALALFGWLNVWWIYLVAFANATLSIAFEAGFHTAVPNLVEREDLVRANARLQGSFSVATVVGPLLAGVWLTALPIAGLLWLDGLSFLASAFFVGAIRTSFNPTGPAKPKTGLRQDIVEGLRYIIGHPVLRNIALMMALVNFVSTTINAQLVFFAKTRLGASDSQVSWLYTAGSLGLVGLAFAAGKLRQRFGFGQVALGALLLNGLVIVLMAFTTVYWLALPLWALSTGSVLLFNINTGSLRQAIVPSQLLGRVVIGARVLAWSIIPFGTAFWGWVIQQTGQLEVVYLIIGLAIIAISTAFRFTALGRAEQYLPTKN